MTTYATPPLPATPPSATNPLPFGLRQAVTAIPQPVDLSTIRFDPDRQISIITEDGVTVPALKHSTGTTSTNTAVRDNKGGADKDTDRTED
jgi:putative ATP-grasp target RiPP